MKKSILVISNMYPSDKYPHYGVFVKNCVRILQNAGYKVDVVSLQKCDNRFVKLFAYILFYCKSICSGIFGKYDAIYGHYASHIALPILMIRKFKDIKIIVNVHGNDIVPETKNDYRYLNLTQKLLKITDRCIAPSQYFKNILVENFKLRSDLISIYPSGGVNLNIFRPIGKKEACSFLEIECGYIYIGYVSRIEKNKGWDIFLRAVAELMKENENIRAIVVGDGDECSDYNDLVKMLGIENKTIKYNLLPQSTIFYVYNALDVFVFPTYRKSESLGLVGLEAMACGTKVVLPDRYGPASYGKNEINCIQFASGNEQSLISAIKEALINDNIVSGAIRTAKEYSTLKTEKCLLEIMKNVIDEQ